MIDGKITYLKKASKLFKYGMKSSQTKFFFRLLNLICAF